MTAPATHVLVFRRVVHRCGVTWDCLGVYCTRRDRAALSRLGRRGDTRLEPLDF
jgi:hypothetical protein